MRSLILAAGLITMGLGFLAHSKVPDPQVLQGALTLGGGWVICSLFALRSHWHGILGAGILALLAAARCAPALPGLLTAKDPLAPLQAIVFLISIVILIATVRATLAERRRRQLASLHTQDPPK